MSRVTIDKPTGALRMGGQKVFPLGLSNAPPPGRKMVRAARGKPVWTTLQIAWSAHVDRFGL